MRKHPAAAVAWLLSTVCILAAASELSTCENNAHSPLATPGLSDVNREEYSALLQVSSDITKRQGQPRRTTASSRQNAALTELSAESVAEDTSEEAVRKGAHALHLITAVLVIALMLGIVICVFQIDCSGRKKSTESQAQEPEANTPGCSDWCKRKLKALQNCCCGRHPQRREHVHAEPEGQDRRHTRQATFLLVIASVLMLLAFTMTGILGLTDYAFQTQTNFLGEPFPSGHNYFPQHIGDLMKNDWTARSEIFIALCFLAGLCLLLSWYPWRLKNTDVGDECVLCFSIPWLSFRHLVPSISLIFLAMVPTSRLAVAGYTGPWGQVTVYAHLTACLLFLGSYIMSEVHSLLYSNLTQTGRAVGKREYKVRMILIVLCAICFILFEVCGFIDGVATTAGVCCNDVWLNPSSVSAIEQMEKKGLPQSTIIDMGLFPTRVLFDTASGAALGLKVAQFVFQVYALIFLALSHMAVWYCCSERIPDPPTYTETYTEAPEASPVQETNPGLKPLPIFPMLPGRGPRTADTVTYSQQVPSGTNDDGVRPNYSYMGAIPNRDGYTNVM